MIARLLLTGLLFLLASCETIISPPPASQLYGLRPLPGQSGDNPNLPINLVISRPSASPALEREFITLHKADNQFGYFARVRWTTSTPELVRFFIIDSLQNQGLFQSVTPDTRFDQNNYRLDIHIQEFQANYTRDSETPEVHLKLAFTFTDMAGQKPLATFVESLRLPIAENRLTLVVEGFQSGMEQITTQTIRQIMAALKEIDPE